MFRLSEFEFFHLVEIGIMRHEFDGDVEAVLWPQKFPEWWLDVERCSCFIILVEFLSPFSLSLFLIKVIVIEFGTGC